MTMKIYWLKFMNAIAPSEIINCISQAITYWANLVKCPHNAQVQRMPVYVLMAYVSVRIVLCFTD